jgi:protein-S-isoprenylcysteine O-methyltransferase Ste14
MKKHIPALLVTIQLSFIFLILITAPIFNTFNLWLALEIAGIVLVFWAVYEIKLGNFNIRPIVKNDGVLVTSGPYTLVRHPMYLATLMVMVALIGEYFSYIRLIYLMILFFTLVLKIQFEEKELINHFSGYSDYVKKTKRLIPFIY